MTGPSRRAVLAGVTAAAARAGRARAASYPDRLITLIVPFAPAGSTDILARIVASHLQPALGQPVIVENRSGASGEYLGGALVARAAPDGYTLLFSTMSVHTMNLGPSRRCHSTAFAISRRSRCFPM